MKLSGNIHPDEQHQQIFYIESPEEEEKKSSLKDKRKQKSQEDLD